MEQETFNQRAGKWLYASALVASVFTLGYMMLWSSSHDFNKYKASEIHQIIKVVTETSVCYYVQAITTDKYTGEILTSKTNTSITPYCEPS